ETDTETDLDPIEHHTEACQSPEAAAQAQEEFLIFCRAVRALPLQCRRAFILKKVYGLSQREVARELGVGEGTVEKHIAKGIVACSAYMAANGYARPRVQSRARANYCRRSA